LSERAYDAVLLDLDGTLVSDAGEIRPRVIQQVRRVSSLGVRVMIATGRSEAGVRSILSQLGLEGPAIVYNGAGLWCPSAGRLIEEQVLADPTAVAILGFARSRGLLPVMMRGGEKFAAPPRDRWEEKAIAFMEDLTVVPFDDLPTERLLRVSLFWSDPGDPNELADEIETVLDRPVYATAFPLNILAHHRDSPLLVVDVQPPCRGKGEALRVLAQRYGIPPERVVAVGDASNDLPMITAAGLGVAMGNATALVRDAADRVIGANGTDALADLLKELF